MKRTSIKWKIFQYLLGFCILLLIILWLFQTVFLDSFYKRIKLSEVQKQAAAIAKYVADEDWDSLYSIVDRRGDLYVEIWSEASGSILIAGDVREGGPPGLPQDMGAPQSRQTGSQSQFADSESCCFYRRRWKMADPWTSAISIQMALPAKKGRASCMPSRCRQRTGRTRFCL